jgi:hypothetical protein
VFLVISLEPASVKNIPRELLSIMLYFTEFCSEVPLIKIPASLFLFMRAQSRNLVKSCSAIVTNTLHLLIAAKVVHNQTELTQLF